MKTINYHMLKARDACIEHLLLFLDTFGDGEVELSQENLEKAIAVGLDISFLEEFLSDSEIAEFDRVCEPALAEYNKVNDPAWNKYNEVREALVDKYFHYSPDGFRVIRAEDRVAYDEAYLLAKEEYDNPRAPELIKYNKVRWTALLDALNNSEWYLTEHP